ncbi:MAG: hypothetical protein WAV27_15340 [Xanthobacteraceae bacterium]|jgi:hypothetical protein
MLIASFLNTTRHRPTFKMNPVFLWSARSNLSANSFINVSEQGLRSKAMNSFRVIGSLQNYEARVNAMVIIAHKRRSMEQ